jgi:hypothetical protein
MADDSQKLHQALNDLQHQVEVVRKHDASLASELEARIAEARQVVAGELHEPAKRGSIIEGLKNLVVRFEGSHPSLASSLEYLADWLGQVGL